MASAQVEETFLPAVAVGTVEHWIANAYYPSDETFLFALADTLHEEYKAIIEAGLHPQLDNPNLPDGFGLTRTWTCRRTTRSRSFGLRR